MNRKKWDSWEQWATSLVDRYQKYLRVNYLPKRMDTTKVVNQNYGTGNDQLRHAHWMLEKMPEMISKKEEAKFNRWLGFVQGILCSFAIYSIDEMREHNRRE